MELGTLGPLAATYHESQAFAGSPEETRVTVVLLHGFGVPGTDLVWLTHDFLKLQTIRHLPIRFVLPMAPHFLDDRREPTKSPRAWFPFDLLGLKGAVEEQAWDELAAHVPEGLDEARHLLNEGIADLESRGLSRDRLVVGGFSQGAMVSADWTFRAEQAPAALIQLSGIVLREPEWSRLLTRREGLPVFLSHSMTDVVLPFPLAERFARLLQGAGLRCSFVQSPGGHSVPLSILQHLGDFLAGLPRGRPG